MKSVEALDDLDNRRIRIVLIMLYVAQHVIQTDRTRFNAVVFLWFETQTEKKDSHRP